MALLEVVLSSLKCLVSEFLLGQSTVEETSFWLAQLDFVTCQVYLLLKTAPEGVRGVHRGFLEKAFETSDFLSETGVRETSGWPCL